MSRLVIAYVSTLISFVVIDAIWLRAIMMPLYQRYLAHVLAPTVTLWPVLVFYPVFTAGLCFFVVNPALTHGAPLLATFGRGVFLGVLAYSAYDLTNLATLRQWPVGIAVLDIVWGGIVCGLAAVLGVWCTALMMKP